MNGRLPVNMAYMFTPLLRNKLPGYYVIIIIIIITSVQYWFGKVERYLHAPYVNFGPVFVFAQKFGCRVGGRPTLCGLLVVPQSVVLL